MQEKMAEIRDRDLFEQPDISHMGECPICCLPQPLDATKSTFMSCCSKLICNGCNVANRIREMKEGLKQRCVFCREPAPKSQEEADKRIMKRIKENNDPAAMYQMGRENFDEGDYETALKYWSKAAELGNTSAHYHLSIMYSKGEGVEKDMEKAVHHWEEAAIGGHPDARHNLGCLECYNRRFERSRRHWIITANLGYHESLECIKGLHADGHASKDDYADALLAYQAAVDATKSSGRETAERFLRMRNNGG